MPSGKAFLRLRENMQGHLFFLHKSLSRAVRGSQFRYVEWKHYCISCTSLMRLVPIASTMILFDKNHRTERIG